MSKNQRYSRTNNDQPGNDWPGLRQNEARYMVTLTRASALKIAAPLAVFGVLLLMPTPEGLTPAGQKALVIMALAVVW